jgi:hypothetical protein
LDGLESFEGVEVALDFAFLSAGADRGSLFIGDAVVALVAEFGGGGARLFGFFWGGSFYSSTICSC